MLTRLRPIALVGLTLSIAALAFESGCIYLADAIHRDAQAAREMPEAFVDGAKQDMTNYQMADAGTKNEPAKPAESAEPTKSAEPVKPPEAAKPVQGEAPPKPAEPAKHE